MQFNRYYSASNQFAIASLWGRLAALASAWWILFLLPAVFIWKRPSRIWFWLALMIVALASGYGSPYGHYYIPAMPFWAVVSAIAIGVIVSAISARFNARLGWVIITACVLAVFLFTDAGPLSLSKEQFRAVMYPFQAPEAVAKRVAEITFPDDYVFIAGSEPEILYAARRRSPTRFVLVYPLMIPTPLAELFQRDAVHELQERPPAAIVLANTPGSWLSQPMSPKGFLQYVDDLISNDYDLLGGYMWKENGSGYWKEPLLPGEEANCSVLLFRRKAGTPGKSG
jgi:hypothetical protein